MFHQKCSFDNLFGVRLGALAGWSHDTRVGSHTVGADIEVESGISAGEARR